MGAWGTGVFQNDIALDTMFEVEKNATAAKVASLLSDRYEDNVLLGVALIDAKKNGIDEKIFGGMYDYENLISDTLPDLSPLIPKAVNALDGIIANKKALQNWFSKKDRMRRSELYAKLRERLAS